MRRTDVAIVGAGHAGAQCAIALRQGGYAGSIALIGDEPELPYERPPLSKEYLTGDKPFERMLIRPAAFWDERGIDLMRGRRVVSVEPDARTLILEDGETIGFGTLVWAAGGRARRLRCEGHDLDGVHSVRTRADVDRLLEALSGIARVSVVGGGYIGLEAAAALSTMGRQVTLFEAADRVLARVAGPELSRFFEKEHRAQGVDIRLSAQVAAIEGAADGSRHVGGMRLADGERIEADAVIVGIGIEPEVAPLAAAGAAIDDGVVVDAHCRTTLPGIYAIGDLARHSNRFADGAMVRLESVQNAHDQAKVAAAAILGSPVAYDSVPWFWSNQYDLRLQTVGLSAGHDESIVRGDPATRSFSIVYRRAGRVVALDCVNLVRDYAAGRKLVEQRAEVDASVLADPAVPLKAHILAEV